MILSSPTPVLLTPAVPVFRSPTIPLGALTAGLSIGCRRPTSLLPLAWDETGVVRVTLVFLVDGIEHRCTGHATGGVRPDRAGQALDTYRLHYQPTVLLGERGKQYMATAMRDAQGFYNDVPLTRIGELAIIGCGAYIILERISGVIETEILFAVTEEAPAPTVRTKSSVTFDAATSAQESAGDGVLSLTHTASGTNRGAFAGNGNASSTPRLTTSITYGGTGMVEQWDGIFSTFRAHAGYTLANPASGAQTVTSTLEGTVDNHLLGVMTMTDVHQTTPVGTPATATGSGTSQSVTVLNVGADDLVCGSLHADGAGTITEGADQTERYHETLGNNQLVGMTQPGTAGGVLSTTSTGSAEWGFGGIAMKAAAAAVTAVYERAMGRGIAWGLGSGLG